uniref:Uncharacterized protein n=1 Tax=Knipowitschia caucasica TaxID=637954 RepID=A0AAV2KUC5_KNICA
MIRVMGKAPWSPVFAEDRGGFFQRRGHAGREPVVERVGGVLNVLIHRNTASNQCTALRLAEQLRGVRQQYIHVATEGQKGGRGVRQSERLRLPATPTRAPTLLA